MEYWQSLALILSFMELFAGIIVYYAFTIFNVKSFKNRAYLFILESAFTVVLVLFLISLIDLTQSILSVSVYQALQGRVVNDVDVGYTLPDLTARLLVGMREKYLDPLTRLVSELYNMSAFAGTISVTTDSFKGITTHADLFYSLISFLYRLVLYLRLAYFVLLKLLLLIKNFLPIILAIALPLRAFAPTRSAGAYLIAISLGFYLVFPFVLIDQYVAINDYSSLSILPKEISGPLDVYERIRGDVSTVILLQQISGLHFNLFLKTIAKLSTSVCLNVCIAPIIALGVTMTFANIVTSILGGKISEISRGLFKLI